MKDTWKEDGRWDELSLVRMYNGIIYMFGFDKSEGGIRNIKSISR